MPSDTDLGLESESAKSLSFEDRYSPCAPLSVVERVQLGSNNLEKSPLIYKALTGYRGHCLSLVATEQISETNKKKNYHKIKFCNILPSTKVSAKITRKPKEYSSPMQTFAHKKNSWRKAYGRIGIPTRACSWQHILFLESWWIPLVKQLQMGGGEMFIPLNLEMLVRTI